MTKRIVHLGKIELVVRLLPGGDPVACRLQVMQEIDEILNQVEPFRRPEEAHESKGEKEMVKNPGALDHQCPRCQKDLVRRHSGKTGEDFIGCSGYPSCTYTEQIKNDK